MARTREHRVDRRQDPQLAREEALRPCRYLGYDRDRLGVYFIERGALELAESQFRRAVWLNPYEPWFKLHWTIALLALKRMEEAKGLLNELAVEGPCSDEARRLLQRHWPAGSEPPAKTGAV